MCVCVCGRYEGRQWHSKINHHTSFGPVECSISKRAYSFQTMLNVTRMCDGSLFGVMWGRGAVRGKWGQWWGIEGWEWGFYG